jgi:tRNA(fMet)-specific endonuclease VapC
LQRVSNPHYAALSQRMSRFAQNDFHVAIVSFHEQILGWTAYIAKARGTEGVVRGYLRLDEILADFSVAQVLQFDDAAANEFNKLRQQRVRVGTMDLRIASIALASDMTVLTRNLVDFQRVPQLRVEDWTV